MRPQPAMGWIGIEHWDVPGQLRPTGSASRPQPETPQGAASDASGHGGKFTCGHTEGLFEGLALSEEHARITIEAKGRSARYRTIATLTDARNCRPGRSSRRWVHERVRA
jgi:hypothetical protein